MLTLYFRIGRQLLRVHYLLWCLLLVMIGLAIWALVTADAAAGRGSDRFLLLAIVGAAWSILLLTFAHHSKHPLPEADAQAGWLIRISRKLQRLISYCLMLLVLMCAAGLLWFSFTTLRLF